LKKLFTKKDLAYALGINALHRKIDKVLSLATSIDFAIDSFNL